MSKVTAVLSGFVFETVTPTAWTEGRLTDSPTVVVWMQYISHT